jgi:hypothetical protein
MAFAMHIRILQERGFSNPRTDDELIVAHQWLLHLQSELLALSLGLALSMPTALPGGAMISYW